MSNTTTTSNNNNNNNNTDQDPAEHIGYILLPNVTVISKHLEENENLGIWRNVTLQSKSKQLILETHPNTTTTTTNNNNNNNNASFVCCDCRYCTPELELCSSSTSCYTLYCSAGFHGNFTQILCPHSHPDINKVHVHDNIKNNLNDVDNTCNIDDNNKYINHNNHNHNHNHTDNSTLRRRSDASLLLSAALQSSQSSSSIQKNPIHVHIQIRLLPQSQAEEKIQNDVNLIRKVDLVLVVVAVEGVISSSSSSSQAMSMLLEMCQCDWRLYDEFYNHYNNSSRSSSTSNNNNKEEEEDCSIMSIFPMRMDLEEIYTRIRSIGKGNGEDGVHHPYSDSSSPVSDPVPIHDIPVHLYTPYLTAISIANLQCTSRCLYHTLKQSAIVPGMKLTLAEHQIRSLNWMRLRESSSRSRSRSRSRNQVQDDDVPVKRLLGKRTRCEYVFDGTKIIHIPHPRSTPIQSVVDDDNDEHNEYDQIRIENGYGGICADEPGLGKTITALSLVLQTMHHHPNTHYYPHYNEPNSSYKKSKSREASSTSLLETYAKQLKRSLFHSYWKNTLPSFSKVQEMVIILNRIRKMDRRNRWFDVPVPRDTPGYYEHIREPTCLLDILKVVNGGDGSNCCSFYEFMRLVRLCFQ